VRRIQIPIPASKTVPPTDAGPPGPSRPGAGWKKTDDAAVLTASLAGDQAAWSELVARYSRLVYSIPHRYGLDREACDDVFQEVFTIFVRQVPRIRRQSGLPKWFITTTHRVCRQSFKRASKTAGEVPGTLTSQQPPPDLLVEWERQHTLRQALRRLGGPCEQLLVALYNDQGGASYADVADQLNIPEGSIGPARGRCLRKLSDILHVMEEDQ
jgi:RNA polymerase sigma factor (sigma-70 family)